MTETCSGLDWQTVILTLGTFFFLFLACFGGSR